MIPLTLDYVKLSNNEPCVYARLMGNNIALRQEDDFIYLTSEDISELLKLLRRKK